MVFSLANYSVLGFWLLALVAPTWRGTRRLLASPWISAAPALLYLGLVVPRLGEILPVVTRPCPAKVAELLGTPIGATIAWAHFLAFDLFVAGWIHRQALRARANPWLLRVVLLVTLFAGPIGFLLWLGLGASAYRPVAHDEGSC